MPEDTEDCLCELLQQFDCSKCDMEEACRIAGIVEACIPTTPEGADN